MKKLLRLLILIFNLLLLINICGKVQINTSKKLLNVDDEISSEYGSNEEWIEISKKINNVFTSVYNSRDLHFDNKIESTNLSSKSLHYTIAGLHNGRNPTLKYTLTFYKGYSYD